WLFVVGVFSGALYPLGLALLGERLPPAALSRAGSCFLAVNCLGCLISPVVAGAAMTLFRDSPLVVSGAVALALLLVAAAASVSRRRPSVRPAAAKQPAARAAA